MNKIVIMILGLSLSLYAQGITNTLGGSTSSDKFIVENSASQAGLVVTGEGNVGIGTLNPLCKLSVGGDGDNRAAIYGESGTSDGVVGIAHDISGTGVYGIATGSSGKGVRGYATGASNFAGYFVGRGYFRDNVGIGGTEHPQSLLSVGGDGNSSAAISGQSSYASGRGVFGNADGGLGIGVFGSASSDDGHGVYGIVGGINARAVSGISLGSSGLGIYGGATGANAYAGYFVGRGYFKYNVGIGEENPSDKLHINSDSGQNALRVQVDGATKLRVYSNGGTAIGANYSSTPSNGLYVQGDIKNSGGVLHTSDERFKTDIKPIGNSLAKLNSIHGIYYNWNQEQFPKRNFTVDKQIGVLAQEVEKEFPELVSTDNDGYKSVNYSKLTPILIEAVKELQKIIEIQQKEIEALKNR